MINYLTKEDLPIQLREIADLIGMEMFIQLIKAYGGSTIYVPTENSILKPVRNQLIKRNFNGSNYKQLSKEFKISEMQVRNIINNNE